MRTSGGRLVPGVESSVDPTLAEKARKNGERGVRAELWWKLLDEFVVLSADTGSFDCVRLRLTSLRMTILRRLGVRLRLTSLRMTRGGGSSELGSSQRWMARMRRSEGDVVLGAESSVDPTLAQNARKDGAPGVARRDPRSLDRTRGVRDDAFIS